MNWILLKKDSNLNAHVLIIELWPTVIPYIGIEENIENNKVLKKF